MDYKEKFEILRGAEPEILQRLPTDVIFLAFLVKTQVLSPEKRQAITVIQDITEQRQKLLDHLYMIPVAKFIDFCLILTEKANRKDIVTQVFGLSIENLRLQRDQIEKEEAKADRVRSQDKLKREREDPIPRGPYSEPPVKSRSNPRCCTSTEQTPTTEFNCSLKLKEEFDAGGSNQHSPQYAAFVSSFTEWIQDIIKDVTDSTTNVNISCISQDKRMVYVSINSNELTEEKLTQSLNLRSSPDETSYHISPGSILFKGPVTAALGACVIQQKHTRDDSLDRKIDLENQYVRLRIVSQHELGKIERDELEVPDRYQAILESSHGKVLIDEEIITPGETQKYVLIRGRAGIGKSTLVQRLMWRWAHGEWATHFKAIFLLSLRIMMAISTKIPLSHLLSQYAVYSIGQRDKLIHSDWLKTNQHQISIILDGLDEIPNFRGCWSECETMSDLCQKATPMVWGFSLMKRRCLTSSTLMVTSRPFAALDNIQPTMMIEVMGLTRERVFDFVDRNVIIERRRMVKSTLRKRPILLSVSAITFYCSALCQVLQEEIGVTDTLTTYTQITAYIMKMFITRSVKASTSGSEKSSLPKSLRSLCNMAFDGLVKRSSGELSQLVFDENDFKNNGLKQEDIDNARRAGLFVQTSVCAPDENIHILGEFVHLSIQEMLAMAGLLTKDPADIQKVVKELSKSGQFNMALLFLYGFAFNTRHPCIQELWTAIGSCPEVSEEVLTTLKELIEEVDDELQALQMVHESQSPELAEVVGRNKFPEDVNIDGTKLTVVDILALSFLLKHHSSAAYIQLADVGLDSVCLQEIAHLLEFNTTVKELDLYDDAINDEWMDQLGNALKSNKTLTSLLMYSSSLTENGMKILFHALKLNRTLLRLQITASTLTDSAAVSLFELFQVNKTINVTFQDSKCTDEMAKKTIDEKRIVIEKVAILNMKRWCHLESYGTMKAPYSAFQELD